MADNKEFAEQIAAAMVELGTEEALGCMARVMCWVAADHGQANPVRVRSRGGDNRTKAATAAKLRGNRPWI